jgi:DnaJ-class molecular chaperone
MTDPYSLLEINNGASDAQIKKAFRKLSRMYHPDRVDEDDVDRAEKILKFTKLTEAKETLLDPKLRRAYDQGGWDYVKHLSESLRMMENRKMKCDPIVIHKKVSLKQFYKHEDIELSVPGPVHNEDGSVTNTDFPMKFKAYQLGKIIVQNEGVQKPNHIPGDIIVINELEDSPFEIKWHDLVYTAKLDLRDLLCGYNVVIPHPTEDYLVTGKYSFRDDDNENILIFPDIGLSGDQQGQTHTGDLIVKLVPDFKSLGSLDPSSVKLICKVLDNELGEKPNIENVKDITKDGRTPSQMRGNMPGIEQLFTSGMIPGMPLGVRGPQMDDNGPGCPVQ